MTSLPGFRDHFSGAARQYAAFRPHYPEALFAALARQAPSTRLAWDCATGNGQAALGVADHMDTVVATDASAAQLREAARHPRVLYVRARAERSPLRGGAVDLVTVAQALHWFERDAFFAEVRRVLAPRGVLAVWSYGVAEVEPEVDRHLRAFYHDVVGPYWPVERSLVETGYHGIDFPFEEIAMAAPPMEARWRLEDLAGYLRTWSATLRYRQARGSDPVDALMEKIAPTWGPPSRPRAVRWPLALHVGRKPAREA